MPYMGDGQILYALKLVQVMPNQSPYDAVQRNPAILSEQGLEYTQLQYPVTSIPLQAGATYAWRVSAQTLNGENAGQTEVWSFRMAADDTTDFSALPAPTNYVKMKSEITADYTIVYNELRLIYSKEYPVSDIRFRILDMTQKPVATLDGKLISPQGENKFIIDMSQVPKLKDEQFYIIEGSVNSTAETQFMHIRKTGK
jgi:hypothetical protein